MLYIYVCIISVFFYITFRPAVGFEEFFNSKVNVAEEVPLGICQLYNGTTCKSSLQNQYVFVPPNTSLHLLEEHLKAAYLVIKDSKDMNPNCRSYALPSLCLSSLPICRTPEKTNTLYNYINANKHQQSFQGKSIFQNNINRSYFAGNSVFGDLPSSRDAANLRRICRDECELLENELCQKEYAIAKRHPVIGKKLPLEDCQKIPQNNDCSSLGVTVDVDPTQSCFWEDGKGFRGIINTTETGKECLRWSWFMKELSDYPELAGQNYCRNPGSSEDRPWCFVNDSNYDKLVEFCNIPRCAQKIWLNILLFFSFIFGLFVLYVFLRFLKVKMKTQMTNIQNLNTPIADKNIYGNSQSNVIEMPRMRNQPILEKGRLQNIEKAFLSKIPQYTIDDVDFVEELGEGAFGKVYKGQLKQANGITTLVAVKALKENASYKTQLDFKREIELISDLKHDNIVCILGVSLNEEPFCMYFEYMAHGDLHEFLIANSPSENKSLTQMEFLKIALQISEGMKYLSENHYVHRDLAARNCLVGDELVVKISDFGLSRDIYSSDYYRVQSKSLLPVRWMPAESILYGKFTTESDVWSFGVVLWEIYSYGMQPYYGYNNQEVINLIRSRTSLTRPDCCPKAVYSLMTDCWNEQAIRRPSFDDIANRLNLWYRGQPHVS